VILLGKYRYMYYPGCTLKGWAKDLETSTLKVCEILGIDLIELDRWYCCGGVFELSDNLMRHLGAVRSLIKAEEKSKEIGTGDLVTICSMCYNVLGRISFQLKKEDIEKINFFMDDEKDYSGKIRVKHFLEVLKEYGFNKIRNYVDEQMGIKVAPYYGCTLLRPEEIGIDDSQKPRIMEELLEAIGMDPVSFPMQTVCCGSYNSARGIKAVETLRKKILESAKREGAELIVTSCPLCKYNLKEAMYFTELMEMALGGARHG